MGTAGTDFTQARQPGSDARGSRVARLDLRPDASDRWEQLLLVMPALAAGWILTVSCWSARVVGLL